MKKMNYARGEKIPFNLQLFADPAPAVSDPEPAPTVPATVPEKPADPAPAPKSFDDILSDKTYQAEFDRRVQKALETAKSKWDMLMDDKLSEADKLAKMTKEEKAQYLYQKKEKELTDKEAAITKRELMAEAKVTLADRKLPTALAELLNYSSADSCKASVETIEKAFQEAVQAGIEDRMKGGEPMKKAPQGGTFTREQVEAMSPEEINKNWESISLAMPTWK